MQQAVYMYLILLQILYSNDQLSDGCYTLLLRDGDRTTIWDSVAPRFLYQSRHHQEHRKTLHWKEMSNVQDWETEAVEKQELMELEKLRTFSETHKSRLQMLQD